MTSAAERSGPRSIHVPDEAAVAPLAARLAAALPARAFVALSGDLGAGKTTLVKAIAAAVGIDPAEVVSPTFGLIHVHEVPPRDGGPRRLVHADLYRLSGPGDLEEIGWEEATAGPVWVFVEWPERAGAALPSSVQRIRLAHLAADPTRRQVTW